MRCHWLLALSLTVAVISVARGDTSAATKSRDDAAWLKEKGTLLFADSFDREEDGNLAKALGNDWNSATANRVPDAKQADLEGAF